MQLRTVLLCLFILSLGNTLFAQDKIYKKNGDVVDAKIKSVGVKTITYLRFDNQSGPEYTIIKNEVEKVVYENGSEDDFAPTRGSRATRSHRDDSDIEVANKIKYKQNLLALAPLQFSENGLGFGLSYEHALDNKGIVAFYLPAAATFNLNSGTYLNQSTGNYQNGHIDAMFYAMPGVKVYPTGSNGMVRYAIGPSLVIASGQSSSSVYDPTNGIGTYETQSHVLLGMIVNNSLNINPSPHVYLGLELGLGFTYFNRIGGLNQTTEALVQGGLKIGYRF